jgi:hypothetical protein
LDSEQFHQYDPNTEPFICSALQLELSRNVIPGDEDWIGKCKRNLDLRMMWRCVHRLWQRHRLIERHLCERYRKIVLWVVDAEVDLTPFIFLWLVLLPSCATRLDGETEASCWDLAAVVLDHSCRKIN